MLIVSKRLKMHLILFFPTVFTQMKNINFPANCIDIQKVLFNVWTLEINTKNLLFSWSDVHYDLVFSSMIIMYFYIYIHNQILYKIKTMDWFKCYTYYPLITMFSMYRLPGVVIPLSSMPRRFVRFCYF